MSESEIIDLRRPATAQYGWAGPQRAPLRMRAGSPL